MRAHGAGSIALLDTPSRPGDPNRDAETDPSGELELRERHPIVCRRCRNEVSDRDAVFAMDASRATRVFANPGGFLHEIVTVRWARGLVLASPPTTEFTWYPGYAWEIALCDGCATHLGWCFSAEGDRAPERFWGLRRAALSM